MDKPIILDIKNKIYTIRGLQVMLDSDLAELYGVETGNLNKAAKRNIDRFPDNFMFQLTEEELKILRFQFGISSSDILRSQFATSSLTYGGRRYLPFVFSEQGVSMLSGVLKSETAVRISIQIMDAFVSMRRFISANSQVFYRLDTVERKQLEYHMETDKRFEHVFEAIESKDIKQDKGIFFDGQTFDAYRFVSDIVRDAKKSIVLIDNYVDDTVLSMFTKRNKNVQVTIYTKNISKQLILDLQKHNSQYPSIEIKEFVQSHDRFLIIDNKKVYHIGASLKDLGKKWFAFCRLDKESLKILEKLEKK